MKTQKHSLRIIGRREFVDFPELGLQHVEAKIDTGAYTSSLHCEDIELKHDNGVPTLYFTIIQPDTGQKQEYTFTKFGNKIFRNSFGEMEERFIIKTLLKIGHKNIFITISLSNRDKMRYPVLVGRRPLKGRFLIDVKQLHLGGLTIKKALKSHFSDQTPLPPDELPDYNADLSA